MGEEHTAKRVRTPERERRKRDHCQTHEEQNIRTFAESGEQRRAEQMEEGSVIVEDVTVRQQAVHPSPHDVQMLWFIRVDGIPEHMGDAQNQQRDE